MDGAISREHFLLISIIYAMYSQKCFELITTQTNSSLHIAVPRLHLPTFFIIIFRKSRACSSSKTSTLCNHILHTTDLQFSFIKVHFRATKFFLKGYTIRVETVGCVKQIAEVIISPLEDDKMLIV